MKFWLYALASTAVMAGLLALRLIQYPNVFTAFSSMSVNLASLIILVNFVTVLGLVVSRVLVWICLGKLSVNEQESLIKPTVMVLSEIFFSNQDALRTGHFHSLIACAYPLAFMSALHGLAFSRVKVMFQGMHPPSVFLQARFLAFVFTLGFGNYLLLSYTYSEFLLGHHTMLMFSARMLTQLELFFKIVTRFSIEKYEGYFLERNDEEQWEAKYVYVFMSNFIGKLIFITGLSALLLMTPLLDSILLIFYLAFNLFLTSQLVLKFLAARRTQNELDQYVTDATRADLARDSTCVVCRDEMELNPSKLRLCAKRLNCGHAIHRGCLKLWMRQSQDCPTCRRPVKEKPANDIFSASYIDRFRQDGQPNADAGTPAGAQPPQANAREDNSNAAENGPQIIDVRQPLPPQRPYFTAPNDPEPVGQTAQGGPAATPTRVEPDSENWATFEIRRDNQHPARVKIGNEWYDIAGCD